MNIHLHTTFVVRRSLASISSWMSSLAQAKPLCQVLKRVQINRKIDELQTSLIDHISFLQVGDLTTWMEAHRPNFHVQDAVFKEVRISRLNGSHVVVVPSDRNASL